MAQRHSRSLCTPNAGRQPHLTCEPYFLKPEADPLDALEVYLHLIGLPPLLARQLWVPREKGSIRIPVLFFSSERSCPMIGALLHSSEEECLWLRHSYKTLHSTPWVVMRLSLSRNMLNVTGKRSRRAVRAET